MQKSGPAAEPSALATWQHARQRLWQKSARPAIALAWLLTALVIFQQLLFAAYSFIWGGLRRSSPLGRAAGPVDEPSQARMDLIVQVLHAYTGFTGTVGPLLVLAVEFTPFLAIAMALWQLSLQRLPDELVVTQLPAEVYAHRLRLVRRVYAWWIGLLCIAPLATQLLLFLTVRRTGQSRWRGSPEEELLLGAATLAALLFTSQQAQLLQLRYDALLGLQWQLLLPGAAFVLLRGAIAAAEVLARDRSSERLTLWDPPFPWHALGLLVLGAGLAWGTLKLRQLNAVMPQWYRG